MPAAKRVTSGHMSICIMKIWNCTVMAWTEEYTSNIEISTWWDQRARHKPPHSFKFFIWSQSDGSGYAKIVFNPRSHSGLCLKDQAIAARQLRKAELQGFTIEWHKCEHNPDWFNNIADLRFKPTNGEHFTDKSITVARSVASSLGLTGKTLTEYLARFTVSQSTLVQTGGKWIGFADYLRHKHKLPALLGTGWSDTNN